MHNMKMGLGKMLTPDGEVIEGEWNNDLKNGDYDVYMPTG